jgi:hypothetical protein
MIRDGSLEKSVKKRESATSNSFPASSHYIKHAGVKFLREFLEKAEPGTFKMDAMLASDMKLDDYNELVAYSVNRQSDAWLPDKDIDKSMAVMMQAYNESGFRLRGALLGNGWKELSYFWQDPKQQNRIVSRVDKEHRFVDLFVDAATIQKFDDWVFSEPWSRDSKLESKKACQTYDLLGLFTIKYGEALIEVICPKPSLSFEQDGVSPPASLNIDPQSRKAQRGKATGTKRTRVKQESGFARAKGKVKSGAVPSGSGGAAGSVPR